MSTHFGPSAVIIRWFIFTLPRFHPPMQCGRLTSRAVTVSMGKCEPSAIRRASRRARFEPFIPEHRSRKVDIFFTLVIGAIPRRCSRSRNLPIHRERRYRRAQIQFATARCRRYRGKPQASRKSSSGVTTSVSLLRTMSDRAGRGRRCDAEQQSEGRVRFWFHTIHGKDES